MSSPSSRAWRFFRAGRVDQVRLDTGADLLALDELDPKLWVALASPTSGVSLDAAFTRVLDQDGDGRIHVGDVVAAVRWLRPRLKNPDDLVGGRTEVPLSAIHEGTREGQELLAAALLALRTAGRPDAVALRIEDAAKALETFRKLPLNGDGVVTPESARDDEERAAIAEIVACLGGEPDLSGSMGVGPQTLAAFFAEVEAYLSWQREADADPAIAPLGAGTAQAWAAVSELEPRIDDYFSRCRLAAFDPRALAAVNLEEKDLVAVAAHPLSADAHEVAMFPLARVTPRGSLPLEAGVNPAWADRLSWMREHVVAPLLGEREELDLEGWRRLRAAFAPHVAWLGRKRGGKVEKLGRARVEALAKGDVRARLEALIASDRALEAEGRALADVERLILLVRDLKGFCENFVSFRDFYGRQRRATFQAGTLYLDRRGCELCLPVENAAAHATLGALSQAYLVYCDCVRRKTGEKRSIVAAVTAGDSTNLMVGRNGLFVDREGREWDATVTRIVDNPISIAQAFWAPYEKLLRWVEAQVARRAAEKDAASQARLQATTTPAAAPGVTAPGAPVPAAPAPAPSTEAMRKLDVGVVAALGVAVGGLTAAFAYLLQAFFGLGAWMPLGLAVVLLLISGPSMLIAWLKLHRRNIGPLLDANGWAVNALARVNIPFGRSLTAVAALPKHAKRERADPYAERHPVLVPSLVVAVLLAIAAAWGYGALDFLLPERLHHEHLLHGVPMPNRASPDAGLSEAK